MKNLAWYHKIWRRKMEELPAASDADQAWTSMEKLLDEHLPVPEKDRSFVKPFIAKLIMMAGYALPAAAMIGAASYFVAPRLFKPEQRQNKYDHRVRAKRSKQDAKRARYDLSKPIDDSPHIKSGITKLDLIRPFKADSVFVPPLSLKAESVRADILTGNIVSDRLLSAHPIPIKQQKAPDKSSLIDHRYQSGQSGPARVSSQIVRNTKLSSFTIVQEDTDLILKPAHVVMINHQALASISNNEMKRLYILQPHNVSNNPKTMADTERNKYLKTSSRKSLKAKKESVMISLPQTNYGIEAGVHSDDGKSNIYAGIIGEFRIGKRWQMSTGVRISILQPVSGKYQHPSYFRPDSSSAFTIIDDRKVSNAGIPVNLQYQISDRFSIKAGPVLNIKIRHSNSMPTLLTVADRRDTLYHSRSIDSAIRATKINKVNIGFTGGVSYHFKRISLDVRYQWLTPYKIRSGLGSYKQASHTLQLGVSYHLK